MSDDTCRSRRGFVQDAGACLLLVAGASLSLRASGFTGPITFFAGSRTADEARYPLPAADGATIDMRTQVILVRYQGVICAMALSCPHENSAVKWMPKDARFQCTKHDSRYTPLGVHTEGRATRNMDRFPLRREGASIVVSLDQVFHSDVNPSGWAAAVVPA